ncbi:MULTISPECIES: BTAD domain-containing putative transcriptional regulator [unclassified Streptomyces]|uniref:BTAD domain-containing putative transcriptional regulator n=1 Tax=unclassified Streptomyces TaxID=2593676 RepID=UPI00336A7224
MHFSVLGPLQVLSLGRPVAFGGPKQQVLLALLLARSGSAVPVPQIVDTLWPRRPPRTALAQIHSRISSLRHILGAETIKTVPSGYSLTPSPGAIDAQVFEEEVSRAIALRAAGRHGEATALLRACLGRWRGPSAYQHLEGEPFDREAGRLEELRLFALEHRIGADLETRDAAELVPELVDLVAAHPTHERFHHHLMLALDRSGRRSDALNAYLGLQRRLAAELGTDPAEDLQRLYHQLLSMDRVAPTGDQRQRQGRARRTATAARPERTGPAGPFANQLPPDIPDFIGRARERRVLLDALTAGSAARPGTAARAVIVSGMTGVGKSALAVHAAHRARESYPDGLLYIDGSAFPRTEEGLRGVLGRLLHGLGVPEAEQPDSWALRQDAYRSLVATRRVMVLIDNVAEADDLRAVIPTGGGCAVCVTTQVSHLAVDGAVRVPLDVLGADESRALLSSGLRPGRFEGQGRWLDEVLAVCGGLPAALRAVGNVLAARPHWSLEQVAASLTGARNPASRLSLPGRGLADAFDEACGRLTEESRRALSALAALDVERLTPGAAGLLLGRSGTDAAALLDELTDRNLLRPVPAARPQEWAYAMHALLRAHLRAGLPDTLHDSAYRGNCGQFHFGYRAARDVIAAGPGFSGDTRRTERTEVGIP